MHSERATGGAVRTATAHPGHLSESTERDRMELMFQEGVTPSGAETRGSTEVTQVPAPPDNLTAARSVFALASLLESQGANPYRVRAYRRAALGLLRLPQEAGQYLNTEGELVLPWLGERLRRKLGELVRQGRMQFQDELMAQLPQPYRELLAVPGIGPKTAARLMSEAGVFGLEALVRAAREGRLRRLRGIGVWRESQWEQAAAELLRPAEAA
jgi:DNA polymerase (family X)